MNSQQLGKFSLEEQLVKNNPDIATKVFRDMQFVPVRAESHFINREIEYAGISPMFEEVSKGTIVPRYLIHIFSNQAEGKEPEYSHVEVTKL